MNQNLYDRGYNLSMNDPSKALVDFSMSRVQDIIPSYEINMPLRIDLICFSNFMQLLQQHVNKTMSIISKNEEV